MNITLTSPRLAALTRAAAEKSTPESTATAEGLASQLLESACDSYAASQLDADKLAMASNERLMALGALVMARPEKLDEVEAAVTKVLQA